MKQKSSISLDELDVKCLTELPVILDVLSATANKLIRLFNPIYEDLMEFTIQKMPIGWRINEDNYKGIFYPLTDDYKKDSITTLYSYLALYYDITLLPLNAPNNEGFIISLGFYYAADDEEEKLPCYFFEIARHLIRKAVPYNNLAFYRTIGSKIKNDDMKIRIYHPETGDKQENIGILIYNHSVESINTAYEIFKEELLLTFLQSVK